MELNLFINLSFSKIFQNGYPTSGWFVHNGKGSSSTCCLFAAHHTITHSVSTMYIPKSRRKFPHTWFATVRQNVRSVHFAYFSTKRSPSDWLTVKHKRWPRNGTTKNRSDATTTIADTWRVVPPITSLAPRNYPAYTYLHQRHQLHFQQYYRGPLKVKLEHDGKQNARAVSETSWFRISQWRLIGKWAAATVLSSLDVCRAGERERANNVPTVT